MALLYQDWHVLFFFFVALLCWFVKGWSNCQKICSWFSCLSASAVHSPIVYLFIFMYCLPFLAKGVRKERRFRRNFDSWVILQKWKSPAFSNLPDFFLFSLLSFHSSRFLNVYKTRNADSCPQLLKLEMIHNHQNSAKIWTRIWK